MSLEMLKRNLREIYDSRNILRSLVTNNLIGRYRNSFFGFAWHFFTPIMMMFVYIVAFNTVRHSDIPDFWIYLSSGLFPFNFMLSNLTGGATYITGNAGMVKKMYFPREILVLSSIISTFVIMMMGYAVVLVAIALSGHGFGVSIVALPLFLIIMAVFSLGYALLFSAITVYKRDVHYALNSINMLFFFTTPMYFLRDGASDLVSTIVLLNPFTYFIETFHHLAYYKDMPDMFITAMCFILAIVSLVVGYAVFNRLKKGFAEKL